MAGEECGWVDESTGDLVKRPGLFHDERQLSAAAISAAGTIPISAEQFDEVVERLGIV